MSTENPVKLAVQVIDGQIGYYRHRIDILEMAKADLLEKPLESSQNTSRARKRVVVDSDVEPLTLTVTIESLTACIAGGQMQVSEIVHAIRKPGQKVKSLGNQVRNVLQSNSDVFERVMVSPDGSGMPKILWQVKTAFKPV